MRKIKYGFSLILIIALILSSFAFSVSAAGVNYSVTSASGTTGGTVTVSVKASGSTVWGCSISLKYNSKELQYVSCAKGNLVSSGNPYNTGSAVNFAGNLQNASAGGTIYTVTFKILMSSGASTLSLTAEGGANNIDSNGNNVPLTTSGGTVSVNVPVSGVSLNKTSTALNKGGTDQLTATVSPSNASNKTVSYSSSNTKVATVNSSGKITAVGGGTATITATAGGKSATCKVTVTVSQTGIAVSGAKDRKVAEGGTLKLTAAKVPADATDSYPVSWSSSDNSIATVSSNGTVTGVKIGTATVTATSNGWKAVYNITVTEKSESTATETSTDAEGTSDESSTDEGSTGEALTDETSSENPSNEDSVIVKFEETGEKPEGFVKKFHNKIFNNTETVSKPYHYLMLIAVGLITAVISATVTAIVTANIVNSKYRKKDEELFSLEDKDE